MANLARLIALAVLAFSAAMARLPSHWSVALLPLKVTAQTVPSRAARAAHSLLSKPPFVGPPLALTAPFSASRSLSNSAGQGAAASAGEPISRPPASAVAATQTRRFGIEIAPPDRN